MCTRIDISNKPFCFERCCARGRAHSGHVPNFQVPERTWIRSPTRNAEKPSTGTPFCEGNAIGRTRGESSEEPLIRHRANLYGVFAAANCQTLELRIQR